MSDFKAGQDVKFKGYAQDVPDPILATGEIIRIRVINDDGAMVVDQLTPEGEIRTDVTETETLFPEEVELIGEDSEASVQPVAETEATADEAPAKKKPGRPKGTGIQPVGDPSVAKMDISPVDVGALDNTPPTSEDEGTGVRSELVRQALRSVAGVEASDTSSALLAAKSLINRVDETYYTLGGVLAFIKDEGIYKSIGYDGKRGFADYCSAELGTEYRKAQYLIGLFEKVQAAGLNEKRLGEIGWSKASQIIRVGNVSLEKLSEDFDGLVDFAKEHTRDELISHIKTTYEGIESRTPRTNTGEQVAVSTFVFKLAADAASAAERALGAAKNLAGSDDLSEAFKYICDDWSMMTEGTTMDLATAISVIEHRFKVRLVAQEATDETLEVEGGEIVEGGEEIPA